MAIFFPKYEDILNLRVKPEEGELYVLEFLKSNLDDSFEIYFNPFLNGDRPDVIIMKEGQGVLIIEVKDYNLESYELDERKNWKVKNISQPIKSPLSQVMQYKENLFNLHIENLLAKKILDVRHFNIVNCAVYFHNATKEGLENFLIKPFIKDKKYSTFLKYNITLIGRDDLINTTFEEILKKTFLISQNPSIYFDKDTYDSFKRFLNPPYHSKEQVKNVIQYNQKQLEIIYGGNDKKEQRIKGVVGSGKTTVLAARAVQAHIRTKGVVLILTYNITLKNYIKDKISCVREDFSWDNFVILNYHLFIKTELNNIGIEINPPRKKEENEENYDEYVENYFEENYYSNIKLFQENKETLRKYDAIFIDEIQDYKRPWMDIIKNNFLANGGEYVLFGDVKQNIYNNKIEKKDVSTNVRGVTELKNSFRSDFKIKDIIVKFQNDFFKDKYEIDDSKEFNNQTELDLTTEQKGTIIYIYLPNADSIISLYNIIHENAINKGIHANDITILGNTRTLLQKFDAYYRYKSNEKTNTMFETHEMVYRYSLNFITKEKNVEWVNSFLKLMNLEQDYQRKKAFDQISRLLTLQDLEEEYKEQFVEKIKQYCKNYKIDYTEFSKLIEKYKSDIEQFKKDLMGNNLDYIRTNKKINFQMNSGTVKISTIHSFKGWESETLFLIIEKKYSKTGISFDELLYTGITRSRTNLFVINYGNNEYNDKLKELMSKTKENTNA